jgi:group II intron reverse transcriptase/maturase
LGISTVEDKVLQLSVKNVIEPIYEEIFKPFSYGFRPGRSQHQAIEFMFQEVRTKGIRYVIDADISDFYGTISHSILRDFLDQRVKDGIIRRMLNKWLKAGVLEDKVLRYPKEGTPQGGIISPLLSNIYLHYVLDEWFEGVIQPLLSGKSFIVRYADDFILGFENLDDVKRVFKVLPKRFGKYNLKLQADKTKVIYLRSNNGDTGRSFDFLGFTHFIAKSRKGNLVLKRKTSKKKLTKAIVKTDQWIKKYRHMKLKDLIKELNIKLRGHYAYYGITFNSKGINSFFEQVKRSLFKWLNRRGGGRRVNWDYFSNLIRDWLPLLKPSIYHSYL